MVGHTPSGCFRSGGQYERRTGHPAFSGQLGHEGTNRAKDAGVCDWDDYTVINQTGNLKDGALRIIFDCGYDDFFFEVNQASIKSCWNEASCTTLLCVPERIRVNIGAIPSIINLVFLKFLQASH